MSSKATFTDWLFKIVLSTALNTLVNVYTVHVHLGFTVSSRT